MPKRIIKRAVKKAVKRKKKISSGPTVKQIKTAKRKLVRSKARDLAIVFGTAGAGLGGAFAVSRKPPYTRKRKRKR